MNGAPVFTLHGALRRAAEAAPDRPALRTAGASSTYGELAERAGRYTAALREVGVEPGDRVAVAATKSPDAVAALYGIMGAGAAYVPVDPFSPPLRAAGIVADAGCAAVCADADRWARLSGADGLPEVPVVAVDGEVSGAAVTAADLDAMTPDTATRGCESDLAYLLYTSGSTGAPKGVMLTHRNALAFVEWAVGRFGVAADDRLTNHAPFHFDLSVFDLYGAALAGAEVRLIPRSEGAFGPDLVEILRSERPSVTYMVPSSLTLVCDAAEPSDLSSLRLVLFAGEVFPMKHLRRLRTLVPDAVMANLYGPTETNVCTYHVVPTELPAGDEPLPIGRGCENQEVFALDDDFHPVADGEVGELWVRGPTVMKGYWGMEERTAETVRQNPLHDDFPDPACRTGDLVRRRADGEYDFLGRRDHQIKSRGYRIELGEIETALLSHPAVREAAVAAIPDERLGHALVAFVTVDDDRGDDIDEMALKRACSERVPRYMIPGSVVVSDSLPRTSTGKIDRQALAGEAEGARANGGDGNDAG